MSKVISILAIFIFLVGIMSCSDSKYFNMIPDIPEETATPTVPDTQTDNNTDESTEGTDNQIETPIIEGIEASFSTKAGIEKSIDLSGVSLKYYSGTFNWGAKAIEGTEETIDIKISEDKLKIKSYSVGTHNISFFALDGAGNEIANKSIQITVIDNPLKLKEIDWDNEVILGTSIDIILPGAEGGSGTYTLTAGFSPAGDELEVEVKAIRNKPHLKINTNETGVYTITIYATDNDPNFGRDSKALNLKVIENPATVHEPLHFNLPLHVFDPCDSELQLKVESTNAGEVTTSDSSPYPEVGAEFTSLSGIKLKRDPLGASEDSSLKTILKTTFEITRGKGPFRILEDGSYQGRRSHIVFDTNNKRKFEWSIYAGSKIDKPSKREITVRDLGCHNEKEYQIDLDVGCKIGKFGQMRLGVNFTGFDGFIRSGFCEYTKAQFALINEDHPGAWSGDKHHFLTDYVAASDRYYMDRNDDGIIEDPKFITIDENNINKNIDKDNLCVEDITGLGFWFADEYCSGRPTILIASFKMAWCKNSDNLADIESANDCFISYWIDDMPGGRHTFGFDKVGHGKEKYDKRFFKDNKFFSEEYDLWAPSNLSSCYDTCLREF